MVHALAHKTLNQTKTEHNASPAKSKIVFHVRPAIYVAIAQMDFLFPIIYASHVQYKIAYPARYKINVQIVSLEWKLWIIFVHVYLLIDIIRY